MNTGRILPLALRPRRSPQEEAFGAVPVEPSSVVPSSVEPSSVEPVAVGLALPQGLFQPVDAASQFVDLPLAGEPKILEQLVAVAFELPLRLLLDFRGLSPQGLEHVIHER